MGVQCSFEVVPLRLMVRTEQQHVGCSEGFWHLGHAGSIPRTYFPAPPGNRVVPILRRVMALSSTMLAEYLTGGLRVFASLVKVCRREDKLSVRRFHSPNTNFFVRE
ncbi:hypothetical protein DPMN_121166 [Dreissena polymorpha]|uniref:Uncharacterized protein n=1 Tax=Dreissena polymorpha TaxID=45954 RepID=A0A9D4GQ07_DREPO|nr:hypothetical protein DPMN_121166 [Dreissena polymorpha]